MSGKMHGATPSAGLVFAAKKATEAFNRAGGASMFTRKLGGRGQEWGRVLYMMGIDLSLVATMDVGWRGVRPVVWGGVMGGQAGKRRWAPRQRTSSGIL